MTQPLPAEATQAAFARLMHWRPSYVTQLKQAGRLVLTDDGRRVRVAESLARIEASRDPSRAHVAARHADARGEPAPATAPAAAAPEAPVPPPPAAVEPPADEVEAREPGTWSYAEAKAVRERYQALAAKREYEVSIGTLLDAAAVRSALADAAVTLRARLEALRDILAPQLAPMTDEARIRTLLDDEFQHALGELARGFARAAGGGQ